MSTLTITQLTKGFACDPLKDGPFAAGEGVDLLEMTIDALKHLQMLAQYRASHQEMYSAISTYLFLLTPQNWLSEEESQV